MNAALLLRSWEAGYAWPAARPVVLHRIACMDEERLPEGDATIGQLTWSLLIWRERYFGERMPCIADCPACGQRAEFELRRADLASGAPKPPPRSLRIQAGGYRISARAPRLSDIEDAGGDAVRLMARCINSARKGARKVAAERIPVRLRVRIEEAIATADPLADPRLRLACPACGHAWSAPFDVAAYCWGELESWAQRTLDDVDRLARAYGWSEHDVLSMSAWRRDQYLKRISA